MNEQNTSAGQQSGSEAKARHGYRNEVNWEGGSGRQQEPPVGHAQVQGRLAGRQPYSNQPPGAPSPMAGDEHAEGNRAERSGRNLDQLERVKRKP